MMIRQPRVRTKTYGDTCFDKPASTLWNILPSQTQNEHSLELLKKNVNIYLYKLAYSDNLFARVKNKIQIHYVSDYRIGTFQSFFYAGSIHKCYIIHPYSSSNSQRINLTTNNNMTCLSVDVRLPSSPLISSILT